MTHGLCTSKNNALIVLSDVDAFNGFLQVLYFYKDYNDICLIKKSTRAESSKNREIKNKLKRTFYYAKLFETGT